MFYLFQISRGLSFASARSDDEMKNMRKLMELKMASALNKIFNSLAHALCASCDIGT